ncbi:MAG: transcriptional repressor LexA [Candidatus Omnitrophica bacterium]|nr:transcriptional repressor LexA [Candidatus Omnitrophota bacterium]
MNKYLTQKQKLVLSTIQDLRAKLGKSPTLEEIRKTMCYAGISSVQRHVDALKKKGYLLNERYQARSFETPTPGQMLSVPLLGNIACGVPLLAIENIEAYIPYPSSQTKYSSDELFFLRAVGDSMNKSDINGKAIDSGDYVLVRKNNTPEFGQRVVALIGDEATIKKINKGDDCVRLEPESTNPNNKPILLFDNFSVQGVVIDVIKKGGD